MRFNAQDLDHQQRQAYADAVLMTQCAEAGDAYMDCYGDLKTEDESELQFIERCAYNYDFDDGELQGACFQEIYDEITKGVPE